MNSVPAAMSGLITGSGAGNPEPIGERIRSSFYGETVVGKKRWRGATHEEREALWPLSPEERYISIDVETDGPVPGMHSMLSIGAAAYNAWGQRVGKFSANLETLPDAITDDRTMAWWESQGDAWTRARERTKDPKTVMEDFHLFALGDGPRRSGRPVMVTYPAAFDAMWVIWYLHAFTSGDPFQRRCIDLKTLAMQLLGGGYAAAAKRNMPATWFSGRRHSHVAVEDAVEQGELFVKIVQALREEHLRSSMTGQDVVS